MSGTANIEPPPPMSPSERPTSPPDPSDRSICAAVIFQLWMMSLPAHLFEQPLRAGGRCARRAPKRMRLHSSVSLNTLYYKVSADHLRLHWQKPETGRGMETNKVSFEGQVVIVTGAGGGLGRAYSLEIARRGGAGIANDLGGSATGKGRASANSVADKVGEEIHAAGGKVVANYDTVATSEGARRIVEAAMDHFGRVDAII